MPRIPPAQRPRQPRSWLVVGAAAAAVVFVITAPLLFRAGSVGEEATEPAPSTLPAVPAPTAATGPDTAPTSRPTQPEDPAPVAPILLESNLVWIEVPAWSGPVPQWISEYPEDGLVASGFGVTPRYSTDGVTWVAEPFDAAFDDANDVYFVGEFALVNSTVDWGGNQLGNPWPGRGWLGGQWEVLLRYNGQIWESVDLPNLVSSTPLINAAPVVSGDKVLVQLDIRPPRWALRAIHRRRSI